MLNCGDEIAQCNGWDYKTTLTVEDSRNLHRSQFNWENAKQRTRKGTLQNQLWQGIEQLRQMRRSPVLPRMRGDPWDTTTPACWRWYASAARPLVGCSTLPWVPQVS